MVVQWSRPSGAEVPQQQGIKPWSGQKLEQRLQSSKIIRFKDLTHDASMFYVLHKVELILFLPLTLIFCYFWPGAPKFKHCKLFWDPPSQKKHKSIVNHCWFWWKINVSFLNFSCQIGINGAGINKWISGGSRRERGKWHAHRFPYKQIKEKNYWIPGYRYWFSTLLSNFDVEESPAPIPEV